MREKQLKIAISDIGRMEDAFFDAIRKAATSASAQPMASSWSRTASALQKKGAATGDAATKAVEQITNAANQAQEAAREGRTFSQKAARLMADHCAAMAGAASRARSASVAMPLRR